MISRLVDKPASVAQGWPASKSSTQVLDLTNLSTDMCPNLVR